MDLSFITAPVAKFFAERVYGHLPSTLAGGISAVALALGTYLQALPVDPKYALAVYALAVVLLAVGAAYKKSAAPPAPPTGFVRLGFLLALLVIAIMFVLPGSARGDEPAPAPAAAVVDPPAPKFGGCLTGGQVCFGPSVSISLVAVDLKSGAVTTGANPGLGYGVTWFSQKNPWLSVGFSGYATFRETADGQRVVASGVFSFVEYLRMGVGQQIGPGSRPFLLLGIGADLGASRP